MNAPRKLMKKDVLLRDTPSRKKGIPAAEERFLRQSHARLIFAAGMLLQLPVTSTCRAAEYLQYFYSQQSFTDHDPLLCVMASLLLASKMSEAPRRVAEVFSVVYHLSQSKSPEHLVVAANATYWHYKSQVITFEHKLLRALNFTTYSIQPHQYVFHFCRELEVSASVASVAFSVLNDSYCTTLCLEHKPETIACAALLFATELLKEPEPGRDTQPEVWERLGCNKTDVS